VSSRNPIYPNADLVTELQFSSISGSDDRRVKLFANTTAFFRIYLLHPFRNCQVCVDREKRRRRYARPNPKDQHEEMSNVFENLREARTGVERKLPTAL
jgi:hypothetical protein